MSGRTLDLLKPDWPAPDRVRAVSTTRRGGASQGAYDALNLSASVGDDTAIVSENRRLLVDAAGLPESPRWLEQVHGNTAITASEHDHVQRADACVTDRPGQVCAVLTADCLPLLLCNETGTQVAAIHAGWRGLAAGVVESALETFARPEEAMAWIGPGISATTYTVGPEVRDAFISSDANAASAFKSGDDGRWLADLPQLARRRLRRNGVTRVYTSGLCTFGDPVNFFSYRRDGVTGRMATLIWIAPAKPV